MNLLTKDDCLEARCVEHTMRNERFSLWKGHGWKFQFVLHVCARRVDVLDSLLLRAGWQAVHGDSELPSSWKDATDVESVRRVPYCKKLVQAVPAHTEHRGREAPGFASRQQQTQPWPTSRPKGSSGSSKKLSKAKRCGNVPGSFLHRFSSFSVTISV